MVEKKIIEDVLMKSIHTVEKCSVTVSEMHKQLGQMSGDEHEFTLKHGQKYVVLEKDDWNKTVTIMLI